MITLTSGFLNVFKAYVMFNIRTIAVAISSSLILGFGLFYSGIQFGDGLINASDAAPGEFPHIVSLRNETGNHFCGGSLVTRRHVVTAAHCMYVDASVFSGGSKVMYRTEDIGAVVDSISAEWYPGQYYPAQKLTPHPLYDVTMGTALLYDIGLITLKTEVTSDRVIPIPLSIDPPSPDEDAMVAGWGVDKRENIDGKVPAVVLQKLAMTVHSIEDCTERYLKLNKTGWIIESVKTGYIFCASTDNAGACYRDSGSPLMQNNKLVGMVIYGQPCVLGYPDIFTTVKYHLDFVKEQIAADE